LRTASLPASVHEVEFRDRAAYLPDVDALVVADLHVGRAAASTVDFPLGERRDLVDRLGALVDDLGPAEVVLAGDVLHEFGPASRRASEALASLAETCRARGARVVPLAGNHDAGLAGAWSGARRSGGAGDDAAGQSALAADDAPGQGAAGDRPGDGAVAEVRDSHRAGDVLVCHGHEEPAAADCEGVGLYVIGHDHPAIDIEGRKRPCFLYGEGAYRDADLLMCPAFTRIAGGATVNRMGAADFQSPLVDDADALRPVVFDPDAGDALAFPPLGRFRRLL